MSERLEKIAGIISWIQNTSGYNATFGDVAMEFGPNIGGHSIHDKKGRFIKYSDDHYYNNITREEFYEAKNLLQKKSYVGLYDPNEKWEKRIADGSLGFGHA